MVFILSFTFPVFTTELVPQPWVGCCWVLNTGLHQQVLYSVLHEQQRCYWQRVAAFCSETSHGICWTSKTLFYSLVDEEMPGFHDVMLNLFVSFNVFTKWFKYSVSVLCCVLKQRYQSCLWEALCVRDQRVVGPKEDALLFLVIFMILKYFSFQTFKSFRTDVVNYRGC